jgi:hypothetical protein
VTIASIWANLGVVLQKDEQWVVKEIAVGWALLDNAEKTVEVDVLNVFKWIQSHQLAIETTLKGVLGDLALIGSLVPATAPVVMVAVGAIDAATAAIDVLAKGINQGTTPLSTIANAYQQVKAAQTAVNGVLQHATAPKAPA